MHLKRSQNIVIWMLVATLFMQAFLPATASAVELTRAQVIEQELALYRNAISAQRQTNSISYATGSSTDETAKDHAVQTRSASMTKTVLGGGLPVMIFLVNRHLITL